MIFSRYLLFLFLSLSLSLFLSFPFLGLLSPFSSSFFARRFSPASLNFFLFLYYEQRRHHQTEELHKHPKPRGAEC